MLAAPNMSGSALWVGSSSWAWRWVRPKMALIHRHTGRSHSSSGGERDGMQGQVEHDVAGGPLVVGMQQLLVHRLEQVADVEVGLEDLELRGHGMKGELGTHRRANLALHAVLSVEQGHEERHRSHAVAEDLDRASFPSRASTSSTARGQSR